MPVPDVLELRSLEESASNEEIRRFANTKASSILKRRLDRSETHRSLWMFRDLASARTPVSQAALWFVLEDQTQAISLRVLAIDALDHWLASGCRCDGLERRILAGPPSDEPAREVLARWLRILSESETRGALDRLIELAHHASPDFAYLAVQSLAESALPDAVGALRGLLVDLPSVLGHQRVAQALASCRRLAAVNALWKGTAARADVTLLVELGEFGQLCAAVQRGDVDRSLVRRVISQTEYSTPSSKGQRRRLKALFVALKA